jgi:carboxyl-terminal processing protease
MNRTASRTVFCLVMVLTTFAVLGGVFGSQVQATPPGPETDVQDNLKVFDSLLAVVEDNYATKVDPERAVYGAIDGMLRTLDPHSKFFDPAAFKSLREDQRGRYYGLGITVTVRQGAVTVVSPPFPNTPAERAGLRVGDVITHVDDNPTLGLNLEAVVNKLKGPKNTPVRIRVKRPGQEKPMDMTITRDEIPKYTVKDVFYIRPKVGYIKLDSFAETSAAELRKGLDKLKQDPQGPLEGLILDLRENPGGLLQAAIDISSTFLQRDELILKTGGRAQGSKHDYKSALTNTSNQYPLVVLINQKSASASEIVSGAIQDHDRGLIVGETSFGKGLVQSVYQLKEDAGLALTTQKWYTPSGRLIQRDYSQISQFDYYNHRDNPDDKPKEIKFSDGGRPLYGGGGINPDHVVTEPKATDFQESMARHYAYFYFAQDYLAKNSIDASFDVSDALLGQFRQFLVGRNIMISEKDFQENKDYLKRMIKYELFYDRIGVTEAQRILLEADPQVLKAIEYLPEAKDLQNPKQPRRQLAKQE